MLVLSFSIIKYSFLMIFVKLFPRLSKLMFGKRVSYLKLFVVDFISMTPIMTVASLSTILNFGNFDLK